MLTLTAFCGVFINQQDLHLHSVWIENSLPCAFFSDCLVCFLLLNSQMGIAQLVEQIGQEQLGRGLTENPGAIPIRIQVPVAAKDFFPRVNFQCRLLQWQCIHMCSHMHNIPSTGSHAIGHRKILHTLTWVCSCSCSCCALPRKGDLNFTQGTMK